MVRALGGPDLVAAKSLHDVREPAGFAKFTVADDVDAELGLFADHLGHRVAKCRGARVLVGLRVERADRLWSDHAARVCGEDSFTAAFHAYLLHRLDQGLLRAIRGGGSDIKEVRWPVKVTSPRQSGKRSKRA